MSTKSRSLREWVWWSAAGAVLLAAWSVFMSWTVVPGHPVIFHVDLYRLHSVSEIYLLWLVGILPGGLLAYWSQKRIREGIRYELWVEGEIAPIRSASRRAQLAGFAVFLFVVAWWIVERWVRVRGNQLQTLVFWPCYVLLIWMNGLIASIGRPPRQTVPSRRFLDDIAPVQSQHWGNQ